MAKSQTTVTVTFSPRAIGFAMALGDAAESLLAQHKLSAGEMAQAVALFAAAVAGENAQPGKADQVLALMQMSMDSAAASLCAQGLWFNAGRSS